MPAGAKPGERRGGRAKGVKNHASIAREAAVKASGITPLEFLLADMRNPKLKRSERRQCARDAAPYVHPKLAAIEHTGKEGGAPIKVEMPTDDRLKAALALLLAKGSSE